MARNFRAIRKFLAPSWLTTGEGELVGYALDLLKDAFVERVRLGLLARFPQNGPNGETAPTDALTAIGRDRRIIQGITETSAAYAVRLIRWLDDHRSKGTAFTMMRQLAGYCRGGFSFRIYDNRGNCYSRSVSGVETYNAATDWDWDGDTDRWSRFWVVIYPTSEWTATSHEYADGSQFGKTIQWGVSIPREEVANVRAIVRDWKPAGTRCVNIIVAFDPASFDPAAPEPDGTWGAAYKFSGGNAVSSRLSTARYLRGSA
jgi:hypothetical protein